ncbi:unnamed protein product [Prunus armeniaca]|uniref:Uncharacterized protein n=1 Tax=Prunus armeniaca TaxID=36596 RepID=A0A6J5V7M0_PRUAR|nr:unnamed protein product [Prunus armeniaca]
MLYLELKLSVRNQAAVVKRNKLLQLPASKARRHVAAEYGSWKIVKTVWSWTLVALENLHTNVSFGYGTRAILSEKRICTGDVIVAVCILTFICYTGSIPNNQG